MTLDIKAIRERAEKATEGPWVAVSSVAEGGDPSDTYFIKAQPHPAMRGFTKDVAMVEGPDLADFIAHARADIPALLAEVDRLTPLEEEVKRLRALVNRYGQTVLDVADMAQDEGDRAYFGSTNDLDRLRAIRDEYFEWRFLSADELAKADAALSQKDK